MALDQTTPQRSETIFSDLTTNLSLHPIKRDISLLTNEDSVKRSLRNILLTNKFERPFNPNFGANIRAHLFEHITPATAQVIKTEVRQALENYEPRALIHNVIVDAQPQRNAVSIQITFSTQTSPVPERIDVLLDRVR